MSLGKLKPFVNDPKNWTTFLDYLDEEIALIHKNMETHQKYEDFLRSQGMIASLRKLQFLRDKVNVGDKQSSLF
jgi:hypothetical protein